MAYMVGKPGYLSCVKTKKTTQIFCSGAAIIAASAAIAFLAGGPRIGEASSGLVGRVACGSAGISIFTTSTTNTSGIKLKQPGIAMESVAPLDATHSVWQPTFYYLVFPTGAVTQGICPDHKPLALSTKGVHQTAKMSSRMSIACRFAQQPQMQLTWMGRPGNAKIDFASGSSHAAEVEAKFVAAGTTVTYDPRFCHRVPFAFRHPNPNPTPAPDSTTPSTTTDTTTSP